MIYNNDKTVAGFTLIELMVVIAIAGIISVIALPTYRDMIKNNCLTSNVNMLVSSIQQARSEAIKRRTDVTISANPDWSSGWQVTIQEDRDGDGVLDAGEDFDGDGTLDAAAVVRVATLTCANTITEIDAPAAVNPSDNSAGDTSFTYGSNGFIDKAATFNFCDDRTGETGRQVSISSTGRPNTNSNFTGCN